MRTLKRLSVKMYLIEIICGIFISLIALSALGKKDSALYSTGLAMVFTSSPLLFQSIIDNVFDDNLPIITNMINVFLNVVLYFLLFSIILLVKKIRVVTLITIILIQIMNLIFRILSVIVRRFNTVRKVIFHLLFFSLIVLGLIYGFKNKLDFLKLFLVILPIPILISIILVCFYMNSDKKSKMS